ncbi:GAF domain-containing protein [Geomesophilobacter sediminis]|uniref:histidine kinase n=1 Tax=Geomesophilobacter sediminis TaxID=2798584 RepID=A0A8J7JGE9_9BACT|nr:GAF domain-containing protein [Geomesophilobacter sediminis]MBJ6725799.1 GAF domain-containing protein [Geomesophilobacter sediminis]
MSPGPGAPAVPAPEEDDPRLAEALRENQAALQGFFDSSPFMMGIAELEGDRPVVVSANRAVAEFIATRPELLTGLTCTELGNPAELQRIWVEAYRRCLREGAPVHVEYQLLRPQGMAWFRGTASHIGTGPQGTPRFSFLIENITERKRDEEKIRRQNRVLEGFGRIFSAALSCDTEEELGQVCLTVAEEVTESGFGFIGGLGPEGMLHTIGISTPGWDAAAHPAAESSDPGAAAVPGLCGSVLRDGTPRFTNSRTAPEVSGIPQDHPPLASFLGVPLLCEGKQIGIIAVGDREGGYNEEVAASLTQLSTAVVQAFQRKRSADELRQTRDELEARVVERTADLALTLAQLEAEFTERMATLEELHEKDQLLLQQSRLAAMGEMINNIAHQWRQPLNALGMRLQNLLLFYDAGRFDRDFVQRTRDEGMKLVHHMSQTIEDFRNFFRPNKEMCLFRVREALEKTISLTGDGFFSRNVTLRSSIRGEPQVYGYFNEFCQVLLNILQNSRDAFRERGIETGAVSIVAAEQNGRSVITIADTAGGIPEEHLPRVFEPYFSTKGVQGTGVGLYMSKNIIETSMGGRISAANTADGAIFTIEL